MSNPARGLRVALVASAAAATCALVLAAALPADAAPARGGAAVGQIAAVTGSTYQVQGNGSQTAVTITASTTIEQTAAAALSAVTKGSCVTATDFPAQGAPRSKTVTSVSVRPAVKGSCLGGFGGFGGARPGGAGGFGGRGGAGGTRPTFGPRPSSAARPGGGTFTPPVVGVVKKVSGSRIEVAVTTVKRSKTGKVTSTKKSTKTVTVGSATTYTATTAATSAALTVGGCLVARGSADSTGGITATTATVSAAVNGTCSTGFGGGRAFGGGFGGQGGANGATS